MITATLATLPLHQRLLAAALVAAIVNFATFYPGLFHPDAWGYLVAIETGEWTNWQPPLLGVLWMPLHWVWPGPQPMLAVFVWGYWSAFVLLALAFRERTDRSLSWLVAGTAFFPMALNYNGQLVKDIAMALCLMLAAGLAGLLHRDWVVRRRTAASSMVLFLAMGGFMRTNAMFAMPPLIDLALAAVSPRWRALGVIKRTIFAAALALLLLPGHVIADRSLYRVKDIHPVSPLQIFDIGGIAYFSGHDGFKGLFGSGFIEKNRTPNCYTPRYWDSYGWGGCKEVYKTLQPHLGAPLAKLWIDAIAAEPRAYVAHRLAHANSFFQFLCKACEVSVVTGVSSSYDNMPGYAPNAIYKAIEWLSVTWSLSPFGPPYVYLLVCLAWMWAAAGIKERVTRHMTFALAASGAMYAIPLLVVGIAHEYRYIYWTMLCALVTSPAIVTRVVMRPDTPALTRIGPVALIGLVILAREMIVRLML